MRERGGRHGEARGLSRMPPASAPRADSFSNLPGAGSGELWLCPRRSPCLPRFLPVLGAAGQGCQAGQRQGLLQSVTSATPALRGPSEMARGSGRQAGLAERSWDRPVVGQGAVAHQCLAFLLFRNATHCGSVLHRCRCLLLLLGLLGKMRRPLQEWTGWGGWTIAWRVGEAPWPSESGIETDGRGGHYHSKDPMGAIQQIPY